MALEGGVNTRLDREIGEVLAFAQAVVEPWSTSIAFMRD